MNLRILLEVKRKELGVRKISHENEISLETYLSAPDSIMPARLYKM